MSFTVRHPLDVGAVILEFLSRVARRDIDIYNEFSLQHELGIHLRNYFEPLKVQFERNVAYFGLDKTTLEKRQIDIAVFEGPGTDLRLAVELKFPRNGQYPEQLFSFCKDIAFLEQLRVGGFEQCVFLAVVEDRPFYEGRCEGIYSYFRGGTKLSGEIQKPTGARDKVVEIAGSYDIQWQVLDDSRRFAVVNCG